MMPNLPPFAPFPSAAWRNQVVPEEWAACLDAWVSLAEGHMGLSDGDFIRISARDESIPAFLTSFMGETASSGHSILRDSASVLLRDCFVLTSRLIRSSAPPIPLLQWEYLSDLSKVYGKKRAASLLSGFSHRALTTLDASLSGLKKFLTKSLDLGLEGDLMLVEQRLGRLNHLVHVSPAVAEFFLAGSDFVDGLISCFKIMNPPLRSAIVTTAYLCLMGLVEGSTPKLSMLTDQLYSLKAAADAHKAGPLNVNDSLVAELVTSTPILRQLGHILDASPAQTSRAKSVVQELSAFRKPGGGMKPKRLVRRKIDKGKGVDSDGYNQDQQQMHIHRMSHITQIQDLFPELGTGFVSKLLDEYGDDTEQVIAHLLEDSLPPHLRDADRSEALCVHAILYTGISGADLGHRSHNVTEERHPDLAPQPTPSLVPARRNVFDNDELDRLAVDTAKLHFGKRNPGRTADDILEDRSNAPNKAAILSALAAFDSDDDERDDTYDAVDVGGTVDAATTEEDAKEANDEILVRAYQADPKMFDRDAATRRSENRAKLKEETGMTDEAIEGWAVMLVRNPDQKRRLEAKFSMFNGVQTELATTAWRASPAGSGNEDSEADGGGPTSRGRGGRGRGRGRGGLGERGRGGGNVAGPTGDAKTEQARRHKEANKGSRANHNRRDQRARKMARGGFPG